MDLWSQNGACFWVGLKDIFWRWFQNGACFGVGLKTLLDLVAEYTGLLNGKSHVFDLGFESPYLPEVKATVCKWVHEYP